MLDKKINQSIIINNPFHFGYIDNVFSKDIYTELEAQFPANDFFGDPKHGGKTVFKQGIIFEDFIRNTPVWKKALEFFSSSLFLRDVRNQLINELLNYRSDLGTHPWSSNDISDHNLQNSVNTSFEFSLQPSSSYLEPHTDNYNKLISFVFYFPPLGWRSSYGGGTTFYRPKLKILNENLYNFYMPFSSMEEIKTIEYTENRMIYFVKSKNSWHSVQKILAPNGLGRRAFMINIELKSTKSAGMFSTFYFKLLRNLYLIKN